MGSILSTRWCWCQLCVTYCPLPGIPASAASYRLLRRDPVCAVPDRLGMRVSLGAPSPNRFGRVRTLMLTILVYSLFTFLGCIASSIWQLALFRFLAGAGIGGEWTLGGVLVAEEWPEHRRKAGAALYAHRLLFRNVSGRSAQLLDWCTLRMARDVRGGWVTPALLVALIQVWSRRAGTDGRIASRQPWCAFGDDGVLSVIFSARAIGNARS